MSLLLCLVLFMAIADHSSAIYCICKDGVSEQALQKSIDYACGAGADCTPILQNGPCFQPDTVKAHCDYAVNSYFQRKGQAQGSCDFSGTATTSTSVPYASGGCAYPSSPSNGIGTGTTTPSTGTTPNIGTTPSIGTTPTTGTAMPNMGAPSVFNTGAGLGPTGSDPGMVGPSHGQSLYKSTKLVVCLALSFSISLLIVAWH